jgi:AraC-like DNA-binding protein
VVGNSIGVVEDAELIFIGPNLYHAWFTHQCDSEAVSETIIQFPKDLFDDQLLNRNQLCFIKNMMNNARRGILFPKNIINDVAARIIGLKDKDHFEAVLELLGIFNILSLCPNIRLLSDPGFSREKIEQKSRRMERVFEFMYANYHKNVPLAEVAEIANMPAASFSRFIKKRTGKTFVEILNEIRLGYASRLLVDTNKTIAEIAYQCGFNNISNFNRTFKHKKLCTPKEFRETFSAGKTIYV